MKYMFFIFVLLLSFSCNWLKNKKEKIVTLNAGVNGKHLDFLNYPRLEHKRFDKTFWGSGDNYIFSFENLRNNKTNISLFSLLTDDFKRTIDLDSDSTIFFDTEIYNNLKTGNPEELSHLAENKTDTIFIGLKSVGCFEGHVEKIKLIRTGSDYQVNYFYAVNSGARTEYKAIVTDTSFKRCFNQLLFSANKLLIEYPDMFKFRDSTGKLILTYYHPSTTETDIYIRQGNTVHQLIDNPDWNGYEEFKKALGIPENKYSWEESDLNSLSAPPTAPHYYLQNPHTPIYLLMIR